MQPFFGAKCWEQLCIPPQVGLTIGSIGSSVVNNITFRDCFMHNTFKGIYTKFRGSNGRISNVLYENIYMEVQRVK